MNALFVQDKNGLNEFVARIIFLPKDDILIIKRFY